DQVAAILLLDVDLEGIGNGNVVVTCPSVVERSRRTTATRLAPAVEEEGPEPVAEAFLRIVGELGKALQEQGEHVLNQVGGVVSLKPQLAGPVVEERRVQFDEAIPGGALGRPAEAFEKAGGGLMHSKLSRTFVAGLCHFGGCADEI